MRSFIATRLRAGAPSIVTELVSRISKLWSKSKMARSIWILGVLATLAGCAVPMIWPSSQEASFVLIIVTIGLTLTLACETRLKLREIEDTSLDVITEMSKTKAIVEHGHSDEFFIRRHEQLKTEINELAEGIYHLSPLTAVYEDDIRSINSLRSGERLLSTCPITSESKLAAVQGISDPIYEASIASHVAAAKRGVSVTRIYFFKNRDFYDQAKIKAHLADLAKAGMEIRVIFLDRGVKLGPVFDFLVFDKRKVSVGVIDPPTGKVWSARVSVARATIEDYTRKYEHIKSIAQPLE
jgi:hypothetical protein